MIAFLPASFGSSQTLPFLFQLHYASDWAFYVGEFPVLVNLGPAGLPEEAYADRKLTVHGFSVGLCLSALLNQPTAHLEKRKCCS